jgi:hypothetical protein
MRTSVPFSYQKLSGVQQAVKAPGLAESHEREARTRLRQRDICRSSPFPQDVSNAVSGRFTPSDLEYAPVASMLHPSAPEADGGFA